MNIDIKAHYWPATPDLREIKLRLDDQTIQSSFMTQNEIFNLIPRLKYLEEYLREVASKMKPER